MRVLGDGASGDPERPWLKLAELEAEVAVKPVEAPEEPEVDSSKAGAKS